MRLPNGYGSVYKLSGKRRKPYAVRITVGWKLSEEKTVAAQLFDLENRRAFFSEEIPVGKSRSAPPDGPIQITDQLITPDAKEINVSVFSASCSVGTLSIMIGKENDLTNRKEIGSTPFTGTGSYCIPITGKIANKKNAQPIYKFLSYHKTKAEALQALADYHKDPSGSERLQPTIGQIYDEWSPGHYEKLAPRRVVGLRSAWKVMAPIYGLKIKDIRLSDIQHVFDHAEKSVNTLTLCKIQLNQIFEYAVAHEFIDHDKHTIIQYLDTSVGKEPVKNKKKPFSKEDIEKLWNLADSELIARYSLIMIYTGVRVGEFMELKTADIHLEERYFSIQKAKTKAGIRDVPISEKIVPFVKQLVAENHEYLATREGKRWSSYGFRDLAWDSFIEKYFSFHYTPHCTRHTCISLLQEANVNETIIQQIVGHAGTNVTQAVYTHIDLQTKLEAINRL